MSQHHEQQQDRIRLKNQTKALYQASRRTNPVGDWSNPLTLGKNALQERSQGCENKGKNKSNQLTP